MDVFTRRWLGLALSSVVVLSACQADDGSTASPTPATTPPAVTTAAHQVDGCVPDCRYGLTAPGDLPDGEYRTEWFFGGELSVSFDEPWTSGEDSSGEFNAAPVDSPDDVVFFWLDVYPVEDFERVSEVPLTSKGWIEWLHTRAGLDVSEPMAVTIGGLPASAVDIAVATDAVNEEIDNRWCERNICVNFLGFDQWDGLGTWGIAGKLPQRLYFSDVRYDGQDHLFVVALAPTGTIEGFAPRAEAVLDTVTVPVEPA